MFLTANAEVFVHPDFDENRNRVANVAVVKVFYQILLNLLKFMKNIPDKFSIRFCDFYSKNFGCTSKSKYAMSIIWMERENV